MKSAIELYLSIFVIAIFGVLCANMVAMNIEANNVRSYHNACIQVIENSGHNQDVINQLIEESPYDLAVERNPSNGVITSQVRVGYNYTIPLLNFSEYYCIEGVAR
ncbi:MAG: hypothetical protein PHI41_00630 [Erysipelotrichaceae bacterium]|nr:hypothetical protein [Erysipelotrichaceae bacterium]MDD3809122.1 hypothetical protein [Erysipelotrichaceae bacterium]